jgi:hypothetical protein
MPPIAEGSLPMLEESSVDIMSRTRHDHTS